MSMAELAGARTDLLAPFARAAAGLHDLPGFLENLPLAIYACDADGRIVWFNSRAAQLWGRAPTIGDDSEKYCGSYRLFFNGRLTARDETPMAAVLRTGIPVREAQGKVERPDGTSIWAMVHIEPVKDEDGNIVGAINCFHDVTDSVRATELLRERDHRLSVTHDHAGIGIGEVDAGGRLVRVNAHLAGLLGYAPEELVGRSIFDPDLTETSDADQLQFRRQVSGELARYSIEKPFRRRDGTKLWISITSSTVCDDEGRFLYAVRTQHDVTAQRQAEEGLARRAEQQAALFAFSEGLQHTDTLDDVYDLALTAILRALRCERAAILLFDDAGVMKFEAWRYLSESYRRAVEGHSPWQRGTINPEPVCLGDIETADLPEALKSTVRAEGIGALAFIPLVAKARLIGKFMIYYDRAHVFARPELDLALTIARQLGWAVERIKSEAVRQRTERAAQHLAAIVSSSHDAVVSKDLNGVIQTWNGGAERLFGYRADEVIGKPITIVIPADRLQEEPAILARIRAGELVDHLETVRRRKDGALIDISLTISPVRDSEGRIIGASKIARDISDRKRAESALRQNEIFLQLQKESLETLLKGASLRSVLEGLVRGMEQQSARRMLAAVHLLSPDGAHFQEAVAPSLPASYCDATNGMRIDSKTGPCCWAVLGGEAVIVPDVTADDKWKAFAAFMEPLGIRSGWSAPVIASDGRIVATFASYYADVGLPSAQELQMIEVVTRTLALAIERKQAEDALRDGERRLQELLAAIPAAIYTTDKSGKITYYNEAAVEFAGRRPTIGSDEWCVSWKLYWPDGTPLPHDQCPMAIALKEGRPIRGKEAVAERPDGTRVPFIPFPTPLRDADGNIVGAINMLVDVSERKQAETQQRILFDELNHRVKNNMQMLQSLLNLAGRQAQSSEAKKVLGDASARIAAMAAAQQVLYGTNDATHFKAQEFVNSICHTAHQMFPRDVKIVCEAQDFELSNETAMPLALILNELLTNAVKHGSNGTGNPAIHVGLIREQDASILYVEDDGPGFDLQAVRQRSSGLQLIQGLARQLRGKFETTRHPKTRCSVRFS
jgi:PAS domain S-box-containing protein